MTRAEKSKVLPEARKLYADGYNLSRICEELNIGSRATLAKWMAEDAAAGNDWDELRKKQLGSDPYAPVRVARKRVEWLLQNQERFLDDPGYDDRLNKALLNRERIEAMYGSADRILEVMEQFALHCRSHIEPDQVKCPKCGAAVDGLDVIREAMEGFTQAVRAGELEVSS